MGALLDDPLIQTAVFPLATGIFAVGLLYLAGGPVRGRRLAAAAIVIAFLAAFAVIVGLPALPPPSSLGRVFWSAAAGAVLGLGIDAAGCEGRPAATLVGGWLAAALLWIALPALNGVGTIVAAILLAAGAWLAMGRTATAADGAAAPAITLLASALAVGGIALAGASASLAQLAFALAAATGGFLLWNWPVRRHAWGASGQVALGLVVLLVAALAFYSTAHAEALLALAPTLFADRLRDRLKLPATQFGRAAGTVALGAIAVLPALAAIGIAILLAAGSDASSGY
jgi:hypothetical protein